MKVYIRKRITKMSLPPIYAEYTRARWGRKTVTLTGTASYQGKVWNVEHTYYIPDEWDGDPKEEILHRMFEGEKIQFFPPSRKEKKISKISKRR